MIGSPSTCMTVGVLQAAAYPDSVQSVAQSMAALRRITQDGFFGAVEVPPMGQAAARAARILLEDSGCTTEVDAGGVLYRSGASLCSLDDSKRAHALALVHAAIDDACALGATRVSLVSGRDPGELDRPAALAVLIDAICELYEYVRANSDVELSLKMADRAVDKHFLVGPTVDGVVVAQRVREQYPDFGLVLNLGHLPLLDENIELAVSASAQFLARADLGNCIVADGDTHPRFGVPGSAIGVAELVRFLSALLSTGYLCQGGKNVVAFEVRPAPGEDPDEVIEDSKRALCAALAQL
jgi:hypothetical protein